MILAGILKNAIFLAAEEAGVKNKAELEKFCEKEKNNIEGLKQFLLQNVRVRNVEIRLAHSEGLSLSVTGVQIHPRYQANPSTEETEFKNGEFDIAILTTAEKVEDFFPIADKTKLYNLSVGQQIAYMGFPMEGLADNGNLDLNRPEAIFKSGSINKITDFNNVYSTPVANKSIIHDIPTVGGASGSPIFTENGEVVAILWGGTHTGINSQGARVASAAQHNMATRIDSLEAVKKQQIHDIQDWLGEERL